MKLVKERLYESEMYSEDQLRKDFDTYIELEAPEVSDDDKNLFWHEIILVHFHNGLINSTNELFDAISDKLNSFIQ